MNLQKSLKQYARFSLQKSKHSAKWLVKKPVAVFTESLPDKFNNRLKQTSFYYRLFKPSRPQRVYLKKGLDHIRFFEILNERKVEYVLLRLWEELPHYPKGEDLNILVRDEHRVLINDLVSIFEKEGRKCDLYTVSGDKNGSRLNVPVFSQNLSKDLLETRLYFNGAFVPSKGPYFASVAYHALFHKGHNSGISGFQKVPSKYVFNYSQFLKNLALELELEVDITLKGLYEWLKEQDYAPAADTLAKIAVNLPEISILEPALSSDVRGGEVIAFVVRERLFTDGLLLEFQKYLEEEFHFDVLDVKILTESEKEICTTQIRGGKWDKGPWKESGGPPVALVIAYDYHPVPFNEVDQKKHSRTTNHNTVKAKYGYRTRLNHIQYKSNIYNGLHSGDNEFDAWFYISLLGNNYRKEILKKVEIRRERYSVKWSVVKLLNHGPVSKVELIKYNGGLAVKKTFRPGKERFLERELYCTKELSKELNFIPTILEEGKGFFVMPYLNNILKSLDFREKKKIIANKKQEILKIISEMYRRGLAFLNFNPESIIITPENELFCTGFSYVQRYKYLPNNINGAYEISGLPQDFEGDIPPALLASSGSFQKVWKPYLGLGRTFEKEVF